MDSLDTIVGTVIFIIIWIAWNMLGTEEGRSSLKGIIGAISIGVTVTFLGWLLVG